MLDTRQRATALLVAGCFFMEMLDGTIVATAAPQMAASLDTTPASVGLVITVYLLTLAVLIPLSGWLTARFGARRIFLAAIAVFTLASAGCAASDGLTTLVVMRVLQGAGGAMMVPVGRLLVLDGAARTDIPKIMAYIVWPGLLAPVFAPLLGGVLTTWASWHWMFLVNIPLGALAFTVARRLVAAGPTASPPPLDVPGVLLGCTGLGALTWAAHLVADTDTGWAPVAAVAVLAVLALGAAGRHLLRTAHPLVNLRTLEVASFRAAVTGGSLFWIVVGAMPFLLPLLFQEVFGWSAVESGAVVLFVFVGNIGIKPATTSLLNRFGFRPLLLVSTVGLALAVAGCALLTPSTPVTVTAALVLLGGAARSLGLTCYSTIAFSEVPADRLRDANALSATANQLAAGLGVAVATVALRLGGAFTDTAAGPYAVAFCLLGAVCLVPAAGALRLRRGVGDAVRTGRARPAVAPAQGPAVSDSRKSE
ncbi:MFS transporter [Streptomyces sp. ASQP_92]|uniref:MFS transporter n=1 Tax=Streptomyces sp. ASQP_92 TaxID=2979116 RepID=UPI0021BF7611|nr:MFS transporter [Streptomyces sp. ASQP_92]MCT9091570.1 MFS transporter [Streptomyces sp. ASQP_92]